ncbi:MAG TPA: hypothetical protein V6D22_15220 [Candidatus Obscuribacterales bacterium]
MKSRRLNEPHWSVPLEELAPDLKRMLNIQWREFMHHMQDPQAMITAPAVDYKREYLEACWERAA